MDRRSFAFSTLPFVAGVVFQIGLTKSDAVKIIIAVIMLAVNAYLIVKEEDENQI